MRDEWIEIGCYSIATLVLLYTVWKAFSQWLDEEVEEGWYGSRNGGPICYHTGKPGPGDVETE
jgi:hypothetical protein